jgi:hypothetical protein
MKNSLEEMEAKDSYYIYDSLLFKMSDDELYERYLWHSEQQEEEQGIIGEVY